MSLEAVENIKHAVFDRRMVRFHFATTFCIVGYDDEKRVFYIAGSKAVLPYDLLSYGGWEAHMD